MASNNIIQSLLILTLFSLQVHSLYFYLDKGQTKCFKDELVKNSVWFHLELTVTIGNPSKGIDIGPRHRRIHEEQ